MISRRVSNTPVIWQPLIRPAYGQSLEKIDGERFRLERVPKRRLHGQFRVEIRPIVLYHYQPCILCRHTTLSDIYKQRVHSPKQARTAITARFRR